jgi:hypothetical protein
LVGETVFVTVTVKELVLLVVMVGENEGDTVRTTPVVEILDEIPDPAPEVTEILEEIADAAPRVVVILGERPAAPRELLREAPTEFVSVILTEVDVEQSRRTRKLVKSEMTTEATPDGFWAAVTTSTSEGLALFWDTVDAGHAVKVAELGKKVPVATDEAVPVKKRTRLLPESATYKTLLAVS